MAISLSKINEEADKRFRPFVIDDVPGGEVVLRNAIRLAKSERAQLQAMHKEIVTLKAAGADEEAALGVLIKFFDLLAVGDGGKRLVKEIGDDPAKLMIVMEMYAEDTQLGEALRSAS